MIDALGAKRSWVIWVGVVLFALWALVRLAGLDGGSYLAPLMAFTPWAAIAALLVGVTAAALRNWAATLVAAVSVACLALAVLPRAFGGAERAPASSDQLRILSANIAFGGAHARALMELVERERPDLLAVEELKPTYDYYLRYWGISRLLPHSIISVRPGMPGLGVYSRLPLRRLSAPDLRTSRVGLSFADGRRLRLVVVHPDTPKLGQVSNWRDTLESLPTAGSGVPWVLVGDFNATLDQSAFRDVVSRGYRDAGATTGDGLDFTWPAGGSLGPLVTIDHVLADDRLGIADYSVLNLKGSDHHAIRTTIFTPR